MVEPFEQILATFQPKKKKKATRQEKRDRFSTHCDRILELVDHQRTETGLKPRLQLWQILVPRSLLESQTHEILVVVAVSDSAAPPEKKSRS